MIVSLVCLQCSESNGAKERLKHRLKKKPNEEVTMTLESRSSAGFRRHDQYTRLHIAHQCLSFGTSAGRVFRPRNGYSDYIKDLSTCAPDFQRREWYRTPVQQTSQLRRATTTTICTHAGATFSRLPRSIMATRNTPDVIRQEQQSISIAVNSAEAVFCDHLPPS